MKTKFKPNEIEHNINTCPLCGGEDLGGYDMFETDMDVVYSEVSCNDCKASWRVVYRMIAFDQLKNAKGEVVSNENW